MHSTSQNPRLSKLIAMVTEQKPRNKGGRKPGHADSTVPWDEDNEIMDRLDQRAQFELAGLSRQTIITTLKISPQTYAQDTHRMKQIYARRSGRSISAVINARAADIEASIKINFVIAADPSVPPEVRVQATRAIQVLVKEDRELRRLSVPLGGEQPQQAGNMSIGQQNNTIITGASPMELLEMMKQQRVAHDAKMAAIDVSEEAERHYFGSDNILPVGTRAAAHYGDDEPTDDDDDED